MEKMSLSFKGMTNVPDDGVAADGEMAILVNMRNRGGELVRTAYPSKENMQIQGGVKKAKWHGERLLELRADGALRVADTETYINNGYVVNTFEVMGNIVVMYTEDKALYSIYRDKEYVFLGEFPEVPEMKMTTKIVTEEVETLDYYSISPFNVGKDKKWPKFSKAFFDQCLDVHYKAGRFIDNALFVVGLRLFDGTYKYSHLYLLREECGEVGARNFRAFVDYRLNDNTDNLSKVTVVVSGYEVDIEFDYDLTSWKDVISSVDVFTSGSIMEHEAVKETLFSISGSTDSPTGMATYNLGEVEVYALKTIPQLRAEIEACSSFYRFKSYGLNGELVKSVENCSPSYLATQERLPEKNLSLISDCSTYVYNDRLHVWNYNALYPVATDGVYKSLTSVSDIEMESKDSVIEYEDSVIKSKINIPKSNDYLSPIISHPTKWVKRQIVNGAFDVEFKENPLLDMSLVIGGNSPSDYFVTFKFISMFGDAFEDRTTATYDYFYATLDVDTFLKKINYNIGSYKIMYLYDALTTKIPFIVINDMLERNASFADYGIVGLDNASLINGAYAIIDVVKRKTNYSIKAFEYDESLKVSNVNNKLSRIENVLRVSAVDNPFYFPTAQTYKFGGDIMGMASNAEAISTGQFGQYPLFVFTTDGIWAMGVDTSGRGAYVSQAPFAREICNGGVCPVSGGVVFTTDAGVMAISGGQVVELSTALDGERPLMSDYPIYEHIFSRAGIPPVKPVRFRDYLKNARLGYDYLYKEVFLFNPDYAYSYVYSLESQSWYVRDVKLEYAVLGGKDLIVYGDYWRYTFAEGVNSGPVVAITRPVKAGTNDYKRLWQAALRCTFKGNFSFYVLGSNDGADFVCITGKEYPSMNGNEPTDVVRRDLVTSMSRSKQYKYFAIAFAGNIEGWVSVVELLTDFGFAGNRLR